MNPDDFEAYGGDGGVEAEIDTEGVVRIPIVPRNALIVIQVEVLERMLTAVYAEGMGARGG